MLPKPIGEALNQATVRPRELKSIRIDRIMKVEIFKYSVLQLVKARHVHIGFVQTEENSWSHQDVWHAFILGWGESHVPQAANSVMGSPDSLIY